jgi:uncharacterized protein
VSERVGQWMQSFTGRQVYPLDMRVEDIDIRDIAHSLSMQCRYNGHSTRFYSVAEHSVLVCWAAPKEHKLAALMHDASEAYLCDLPRPVKNCVTGYKEAEAQVEAVIAERYGFSYPHPAEVKELDNRILLDERDQIMAPPPADWNLPFKPLGITLHCWSPERAETMFLHMFDVLGGKR